MSHQLLLICSTKQDRNDIAELINGFGFQVITIYEFNEIESTLINEEFSIIIADYGLSKKKILKWNNIIQDKSSKAFFIIYGENIDTEDLLEMMHAGIFSFIPKKLLPGKLAETIKKGLENRNAFIEILGMTEKLKDVNARLKQEKRDLRKKNEELKFINRITAKVAYDLNWDDILFCLINAGLNKIIKYNMFAMLFRVSDRPRLVLHVPEGGGGDDLIENIKRDIRRRFLKMSSRNFELEEIIVECHQGRNGKRPVKDFKIPVKNSLSIPLKISDDPLGMIYAIPKDKKTFRARETSLLLILSNILALSLQNAQKYHQIKEMAITDGLTGIYNYRAFLEFIKREFKKSKRYNKPLSLIMIDVDDFKAINDNHGHLVGDHVLKEIAVCLRKSVRDSDILVRYGGDEFAVILPETGNREAESVVGRMLEIIENHHFGWNGDKIKINISYGISCLIKNEDKENESENSFISRADSQLYQSKDSRRYAICQRIN